MINKMIVSASPFITAKSSTRRIMIDVCIALVPAIIVATIYYGLATLALVGVCVVAAVASELVFNIVIRITKEKKLKKAFFLQTGSHTDFSAVVTGILLALNLPAQFPLYWAALGAVFAIVIVKMVFGGIGRNFMNPALAARVFLFIAFGSLIASASPNAFAADGTSTVTWLGSPTAKNINLLDMFLGLTPSAAIGEVCVPALLVGFAYLIVRKVVDFKLPLYIIVSTFVFALLFDGIGRVADDGAATALLLVPMAHVMSGGLIFGAIFMATDYATNPNTELGTIIFGVGISFLAVLIRVFASFPEGVSFAILIMNILTPLIDKVIISKPFSKAKEVKA